MSRIILTFETLHKLLAAERLLRGATSDRQPKEPHGAGTSADREAQAERSFKVRTTPTPPGLTASVCGMSLEIMRAEDLEPVLHRLKSTNSSPQGVHRVD